MLFLWLTDATTHHILRYIKEISIMHTIIRYLCPILFIAICFFHCRDEKKVQNEQTTTITQEKTVKGAHMKVSNFDSLLNTILPLENKIMTNPSDQQYINQLLEKAFNTETKEFYCVGKGIINSKQPLAAQHQGMRRAAKNTGERWALYLKAWQKDSLITLENEIAGKLHTTGTLLYEKIEGDTLYQLLAIPSDCVHLL